MLQANRGGGFRSATVIASLAAHVVLLGGWAVRSLWRVDELPPPTTSVLLHLHATPPPAPTMKAAAAAGGGARPTTAGRASAPARRPAPRAVPRPTEMPVAAAPVALPTPPAPSAPAAEPASQPTSVPGSGDGQGSGVASGVGAVGRGAGPGTSGAPGGFGSAAAPKFLPEALAKSQRIGGGDPTFPPSLARAGVTYVVQAKICVSPDGTVDRVNVVKAAEPTLDGNVVAAVRGWRYRPLMAAGMPVPFCTFVRFEFRGE